MMGSGERGVSICFTTWSADADRFGSLNEIASPIVPTGTIRVTLAGEVWPAVVPFDRAGVSGLGSGPINLAWHVDQRVDKESESENGYRDYKGEHVHGNYPPM